MENADGSTHRERLPGQDGLEIRSGLYERLCVCAVQGTEIARARRLQNLQAVLLLETPHGSGPRLLRTASAQTTVASCDAAVARPMADDDETLRSYTAAATAATAAATVATTTSAATIAAAATAAVTSAATAAATAEKTLFRKGEAAVVPLKG